MNGHTANRGGLSAQASWSSDTVEGFGAAKLASVEKTDPVDSSRFGLVVWRDGHLVPFADATVHVMSHMAARGSQVFDVLAVLRLDAGPHAVGLREHTTRFLRSAELMGMVDVGLVGELEAAVGSVVLANHEELSSDQPDGYTVKLIAAWEDEPIGVVPASLKPTVYIVAVPNRGHRLTEPCPTIRAKTATMPKIPASVLPPGLKVAASYTGGVREQMQAKAEGFDEVIFKTIDGDLAESTTLSTFVVTSGRLMVPPLDAVLDGITRRLVLDVAASLGIPIDIRSIRWSEVASADELFLSSTNKPVLGLSHLDSTALSSANPITRSITAGVISVLKGEHELSSRWLTSLQ